MVRNVFRSPGRSLLGVVSLAIGVAALTLLVVVTVAFRGSVSGTVLGDAVSVQVRSTDYVAAGITVLLGAVSVADVLYLGIRERSAEFALLTATGWSDRSLARLAGSEAVLIGLLGAVTGALAALAAAAALHLHLPASGYLAAALGLPAGAALAALAALLPLRSLRRLPTARLLAEE